MPTTTEIIKSKFEDRNIGFCYKCDSVVYIVSDDAFRADREKSYVYIHDKIANHRCPKVRMIHYR